MGPQRQRRRRTRKRRYVSLRRKLSRITSLETPHIMVSDDHHRQLDLFPLHPQPIHDGEEEEEGKYAAKFFDQECDTLNSILGLAAGPDEEPASPPDRLDSHQTKPSGGGFLARRALKGRERWEFCNDDEEGEGSSGGGRDTWWDAPRGMLCLKLDYQEILNAWSDKGPLYVDAEETQVVPSVSPNQRQLYEPTSVYVDMSGGGGGREGGNNSSSCSRNLWMVPESREARVMRYRQKKQSRLFAKKIRYEVRKLNAEKRPRIKGRFVKRVEVK